MKIFFVRFCIVYLLFVNLSCSRNSGLPPIFGIKTINLSYVDSSGLTKGDFELIISTGSGEILLDTVAAVNRPMLANLSTNAALVDVTVIVYSVPDAKWAVTTYKSVDPSTWTTANQIGFWLKSTVQSSQPAKALFTYVPGSATPYWQLADDLTVPAYSGTYSVTDPAYPGVQTLSVSYTHHSNNAVFLFFPYLSLYKYFQPASGKDTIDLSHMDTAVTVNYYNPGYVYTALNVTGVPDTTDPSKNILIYIPTIKVGTDSSALFNLSYPAKYFQKYELKQYAHKGKDYVYYYSYGRSVPSSIQFLDESYYSIHASQNNNFNVSFSVRPVYYATEWLNASVDYTLYISPDSAQTHPVEQLASLKCRKLNGIDLNDLTLHTFYFEFSPDFNYVDYISFRNNKAKIDARKWSQISSYTRRYY